ncbi:putative late blight resistance protein homolog R1A-4 [Olea europaea var. sylvestris]|uniref:putative late blight resistance protein homolog R1A-4 n=1 Tax=Olea europaea var. sylvestris TaxID=158386 RepID=UPI000C1CEC76|nr:putative late blight resistance protein homolog R1A-4 [Olea europaea var. sylvestris]XP_022878417.1 putative late blight resistance protein homolog R1A-4 [Olea europaea var. sylvestris]
MGNCFSFARDHMKRLKLLMNGFLSRDDQAMHLHLLKEDLLSLTGDDHVKHPKLPEKDLIFPADDQVTHLELTENDLISPAGDQAKHLALPEKYLTSPADDQVTRLELPEDDHVKHLELPEKDLISLADDQARHLELSEGDLLSPTDDDHVKHLGLLENDLISPADDQVKHLQLPEDLLSAAADDHVKYLEFPEKDLISPADDQVKHLESPENDLISPAGDQAKHLELPENGLIFHADPVRHLEWLENNCDFIVPIKDQIQTLKVELRFLRTYLKGLQGKDPKYSLGEPFKGFLGNAASELFSLCLGQSRDRSITRDLGILISTMQEKMYQWRPAIKRNYLNAYFDSKRNDPVKNKLVMELVDSLLENLKDLQSSENNSIVLVKSQLEALEEKLLFIRNFFRFSTMRIPSPWLVGLGDSGDDNKREILESLLTRIEYVADNAAFLSYCCLVDKEHENVRLKCNFFYLVWMIEHIEPEVKEICVRFLKEFEPLNLEILPFNLYKVVAIDSLLDNLVMLHNCESHFMAPVKDNLLILYDELIFLRTFLMDPPPRKNTENEKMDSLLNNVEPLFSEAGSVIGSFLDELEIDTANKMNLSALLEKINLIKSEVRDRYTRRLNHLQSNSLGIDGVGYTEPLFSEAGSVICSFLDNMEVDNAIKMNLSALLEKINLIKSEVRDRYTGRLNHLQSNSLGIDGVGYIDSLLKNLVELLNCQADSIVILKHQIELVHDELNSLKSSLEHIIRKIEKQYLKDLMKHVMDVAHKAEYIINSYVVRDCPVWNHMLWISDLLEEIKLIKEKIKQKIKDKSSFTTETNVRKTTPLRSAQAHTEVVIGFKVEAQEIIEQLIGGPKRREIISIVGMAGLGKTTLAKKVYNDPSVTHYFDVRAWCCASQAYQRRELLLDILSHFMELTDTSYQMSDEDLALSLYKSLNGMRYLIVIDDVWIIDPWDDLKRIFPDDQIGSRIMITSRIDHAALHTEHNSSPHFLPLFSEAESWELLQAKLFQQEKCPMELVEVGKEIARKCSGLPLAVVVIAGLLAKMDKKNDQWKKVAKSLSSLVSESRQYMDMLELSYNHLPHHLKPCFLFFGAFAASKEISVNKLLRLWIAEGFVQKSKLKSVEDTAEDYLMDLICRSLVIAGKKRSKGGVKTCHIHDLLHDLCMAKAKQENFLKQINGYDELYAPYFGGFDVHSFVYTLPQKIRLSIYCSRNDIIAWKPANKQVCTLLYFATDDRYSDWTYPWDFSAISYSLKLLKVLDWSSISFGDIFPSGIQFLVHLRYLGVRGGMNSIPSSISNLVNLEVLFVKGVKGEVVLPDTIWEMVSLRHLHIEPRAAFSLPKGRPAFRLQNLETLCTPCFSYGNDTKNLIRAFPSLRKLKCIFMESWDPVSDCNRFPDLESLSRLESLKVIYQGILRKVPKFNFPSHLKKLTLKNFCLPWSGISEIATLPNLEVLKLLSRSFVGEIWEMGDDEFLKLKYLKLDALNLAQWNASSDHFPHLERLVLHKCEDLEEIPSCLGRVPNLQLIEMEWCKRSAENSARQIQEEQKDFGGDIIIKIISKKEVPTPSSDSHLL